MTTPSPARLQELAVEASDHEDGSSKAGFDDDALSWEHYAYACRFTAAALASVGKVSGERAAELIKTTQLFLGCNERDGTADPQTIANEQDRIALMNEALASRATIAALKDRQTDYGEGLEEGMAIQSKRIAELTDALENCINILNLLHGRLPSPRDEQDVAETADAASQALQGAAK